MPPISERLFSVEQETYTSDDYYTPKWIFDALGIVFDLDVACPPQGPLHTPCSRYFTQKDDGLSCEWQGNVFMNPPYSKATPWVKRFINHKNGIALLPMAKSQWFNDIWDDCEAIVVLPCKLIFEHPEHLKGSIFLPAMLAAYGSNNLQALHNLKIGRVR